MFKLLVSNTLSNSAIAFWDSGPGMAVLTCGFSGSPVKNGLTLVVAYVRTARGRAFEAIGGNWAAALREAIVWAMWRKRGDG